MLIKSILSSITKIIPLPENTNTSSSLGNGSGDGLLNGISSGNGEHNYGIGNGIAPDGVELTLAIVDRNPEALATKSSTLVLSKAGEKTGEIAGLAAAGKCAKVAIKRLDPRKATVVGLTCAGAAISLKYWLKDKGDELGNTVGKTKTAIETAQGVLDAVDILDQVETKAAEKAKQEAIKREPMLEWHIIGAD